MKKSQLHNIKEFGFKTPDTYFDTFDERLFKKLSVKKDMASLSNSGHTVPDEYFDGLDAKIQARLKKDHSSKVITLMSWRNAAYVSGIAASLMLMFGVFMRSPDKLSINQVETASIEDYLTGQNLNIYDIASLLNEDDMQWDDFVPNKLTEESLESYLLNNASIEDLILEK